MIAAAPRHRRSHDGVPRRRRAATVMDRIAKGFDDAETKAPSPTWLATRDDGPVSRPPRRAGAISAQLPAGLAAGPPPWLRHPLRSRRARPRVVVVGAAGSAARPAHALLAAAGLAVTLVEPIARLHRLPVQQSRDRRPAQPSSSSTFGYEARAPGTASTLRAASPRRGSMPTRARVRARRRRAPRATTGSCSRPASTCASTRCPGYDEAAAETHAARLEGRRADPAAARGSSKPWRTAASS